MLVGCGDEGLGPRFRGDDGGGAVVGGEVAGMTRGCAGGFAIERGLVGCGYGGLGPRFRGDDGGGAVEITEGGGGHVGV